MVSERGGWWTLAQQPDQGVVPFSRLVPPALCSARSCGTKHAGDLLSCQHPGPTLLRPRDALNCPGLLHKGLIKLCRHSCRDAPVVAWDLCVGNRDRSRSPQVLGGVAEVAGYPFLFRRRGQARRRAVRGPDGRQARQARERRPPPSLLCQYDLVEEPDGRVCGWLSFPVMNKLVESCRDLMSVNLSLAHTEGPFQVSTN